MVRASIIIMHEKKILLIHRFKDGREYYVIPGGGSQPGETPEQTALREAKEETGYDVVLERKLWEFTNPMDNRLNVYFLAKLFSGTLSLGGPERDLDSPGNRYILEWHSLDGVAALPLFPEIAKKMIVDSAGDFSAGDF